MRKITYILVAFVLVSLALNYFQYKKEPIVITQEVYRDTTIVIHDSINIEKYVYHNLYTKVDNTDTITIGKQQDLIDSLIFAMNNGEIITISDTVKFATKDSLITNVKLLYPYIWSYQYYPAPDTIFKDSVSTVITITKTEKPWITLRVNGILPLNNSGPLYLTSDLLFDISGGFKAGAMAKYSVIDGKFGYGAILAKEWGIKNPIRMIF